MNRLEKIISADIRNTKINKKDLDYCLDSEQTEYACKKMMKSFMYSQYIKTEKNVL